MMEDESFEESHDLVMPFMTCRSKGGPHEDDSYVAGWEMGQLDTFLKEVNPAVHFQNILTENKPQADLIAMNHGYKINFIRHADNIFDDWTWIELTKTKDE